MVKPSTIHLVLALAFSSGWDICQLDIKNAFLHGYLEEEIYMRQPPGFVHPTFPDHVCHLHKSLFGLKQAPEAWFTRFSTFLLSNHFTSSDADTSLFIYRRDSHIILLFLLYVDDIILTGTSPSLLRHFIDILSKEFTMKDLGPLYFFLGIQATPHSKGLFLSQQKYAIDVLCRFGLGNSATVKTPLPSRVHLSLTEGDLLVDPTEYRSLVGALQYIIITRPDICFAVGLVSQFMHAPRTTHL